MKKLLIKLNNLNYKMPPILLGDDIEDKFVYLIHQDGYVYHQDNERRKKKTW